MPLQVFISVYVCIGFLFCSALVLEFVLNVRLSFAGTPTKLNMTVVVAATARCSQGALELWRLLRGASGVVKFL